MGVHPCILPSFYTEETLKYNATSKNYHVYGSSVEYMGAPPFVPPFQKISNHEISVSYTHLTLPTICSV